MSKQLKITIPSKGLATGASKINIEAVGYSGPACSPDAKKFAELLGEVEHETPKEEYYAESTVDGMTTADG